MKIGKKILSLSLCTFMAAGTVLPSAAVTSQPSGESIYMSEYSAEPAGRQTINFNNDWHFWKGNISNAEKEDFDDSKWLYVNLPHSVDHYTADSKDAYLGVCWYRKTFTIDESLRGRKLMLNFEAAMQTAEVWLNGEKIAEHKGGYTPFNVDISSKISYGEPNVVSVKIDTKANKDIAPGREKPDFQYWGGLYGNSYITVTDKLHISDVLEADIPGGGGVFITAPEVSAEKAKVKVKTNVANQGSAAESTALITQLIDDEGQVVASQSSEQSIEAGANVDFTHELSVENPRLWSVYTPELYTVRTIVKTGESVRDSFDTTYGIRKVEWKADGLYINDEIMDIESVNLHGETYMLANAITDNAIYEEVKRVKEYGFDGVRMAHYPHKQAYYDACDKYGVIVLDCMAGWQNHTDTEAFDQNCYDQLREMIKTHRNNPSIVAWEPSLNESWYEADWANEMNRIAHEEYPTDGVSRMYTAGCYQWQEWDIGLGTPQANIFHPTGNSSGTNPKYSDKPIIIAEYGDWNYGGSKSTTRVTREGKNSYGYAGGDEGMLIQADNMQEAVAVNRRILEDRLGMAAYWHYSDYAGFDSNKVNTCGLVDLYRLPKHSAYFWQSQRSADVDMSEYGIKTGPMVYIANTWAEDSPTDVRIFTNCDTVELFLNGKSLGEKGHDETIWGPHGDDDIQNGYPKDGAGKEISAATLKNAPITFKVGKFEAGELKAVAKIKGRETVTYIRNTPKNAAKLNLRPENEVPLKLDGSDSKLVWIDVTDENGTVVNTSYDDVTLTVDGPGIVVGEKTVQVRGGQLAVWVRSKRGEGDIALTASAPGLTSKTITISTETVEGLPEVPVGGDADETLYTQIGEIENVVLNKPVTASSVNNSEAAERANDGNPSTQWCAKGRSESGWWQVDLEDKYKLSKVKLEFENEEGAYKFVLQGSVDGVNYETIKDFREGDGIGRYAEVETDRVVRYLRVYDLMPGNTRKWPAIREVSASGTLYTEGGAIENIVRGKSVEASSYAWNSQSPDKANDGDTETFWSADRNNGKAWWQVDLEDKYKLSKVNISFEKEAENYNFVLQGSLDGVHYETIKDFSSGDGVTGKTEFNTDAIVRYLRVSDLMPQKTNVWPSIREISASGKKAVSTLSSVSREKQAFASSSAEDSEPSYGSNGVPGWFWYPATLGDEWWYIDTYGFYDLDNVEMTWNESEAHKYKIEISTDGVNWTVAADRSGNTSVETRTHDQVQGLARFIKVSLPAGRTTKQGFGLFDAYAPEAQLRDVTSVTSPEAVTAKVDTAFEELNLPEEIKVELEGDISAVLPVVWSADGYRADKPGEQTLKGTIQKIDGAVLKNSDITISVNLEDSGTEERLNGDLDLNGRVDAADLAIMRKLLLGVEVETEANVDVNDDRSFDIKDLIRLKKIIAGLA